MVVEIDSFYWKFYVHVLKSELLEFNYYVSIGDSTYGGYERVVSNY